MIYAIFALWIFSSAWIAARLCETPVEKVLVAVAILMGPFACPVAWLVYPAIKRSADAARNAHEDT